MPQEPWTFYKKVRGKGSLLIVFILTNGRFTREIAFLFDLHISFRIAANGLFILLNMRWFIGSGFIFTRFHTRFVFITGKIRSFLGVLRGHIGSIVVNGLINIIFLHIIALPIVLFNTLLILFPIVPFGISLR